MEVINLKKIILFINLILLITLCTSCDSIISLFSPCSHEFITKSSTFPTCVETGLTIEECSKCGKIKKSKIPTIPHSYQSSTKESTCKEEGYILNKCQVCGDEQKEVIKKLDHVFGDYEVIITPTDVSDGLQIKKCVNCDYTIEDIIISKSYIDMDVIIKPYYNDITNYCLTYDEALLLVNQAILDLSDKLVIELGFEFDFNELIDKLFAEAKISFDYQAQAKLEGNILTLTFNYHEEPSLKTSMIAYTQHNSLNYNPNQNPKTDKFKIDDSLHSFTVKTTEQLHYALERGVKPLPISGSNADKVYNIMKDILKNIISDDMDDVEKVLAIHDYLIMNVTYDEELLQMINLNLDLKQYKGFYFIDKVAVCEGISKAFTTLCNIEGIPCVTVVGYQTNNPTGVGHAWNKVYLHNAWYIVDVTSDGTVINSSFEVLSYNNFLVKEEDYIKKYTGKTFNNIICNTDYNPYQLFEFDDLFTSYDYVISSQHELNKIVKYFESNNKTNLTIEFIVTFDYGEGILDEIEKAYQANLIFSGFSYIINDNKVLLIK